VTLMVRSRSGTPFRIVGRGSLLTVTCASNRTDEQRDPGAPPRRPPQARHDELHRSNRRRRCGALF
jgi:hypothetical protein